MIKKFRTKSNEKGFTLIELMIVIAIIGILAAIAIPQFSAYRMRSFNTAATSDVVNTQKSEAAFYNDWAVFGSSQIAAVATGTAGVFLTGPGGAATGIGGAGQYLQIPLSNRVTLICNVDGTGSTFTVTAKHLGGNRAYGAEFDSTATYFVQDDTATGATAPGTAWATSIPATTPAVDLTGTLGAGTWTVM